MSVQSEAEQSKNLCSLYLTKKDILASVYVATVFILGCTFFSFPGSLVVGTSTSIITWFLKLNSIQIKKEKHRRYPNPLTQCHFRMTRKCYQYIWLPEVLAWLLSILLTSQAQAFNFRHSWFHNSNAVVKYECKHM